MLLKQWVIKSNLKNLQREQELAQYLGSLVKSKKNYQVGEVKEIRGKRAIVQIGVLPMNVDLADLIVVEKIEEVAK